MHIANKLAYPTYLYDRNTFNYTLNELIHFFGPIPIWKTSEGIMPITDISYIDRIPLYIYKKIPLNTEQLNTTFNSILVIIKNINPEKLQAVLNKSSYEGIISRREVERLLAVAFLDINKYERLLMMRAYYKQILLYISAMVNINHNSLIKNAAENAYGINPDSVDMYMRDTFVFQKSYIKTLADRSSDFLETSNLTGHTLINSELVRKRNEFSELLEIAYE